MYSSGSSYSSHSSHSSHRFAQPAAVHDARMTSKAVGNPQIQTLRFRTRKKNVSIVHFGGRNEGGRGELFPTESATHFQVNFTPPPPPTHARHGVDGNPPKGSVSLESCRNFFFSVPALLRHGAGGLNGEFTAVRKPWRSLYVLTDGCFRLLRPVLSFAFVRVEVALDVGVV